MLFPTLEFAVFFLLVWSIAWKLSEHNFQRKIFLLIASYFFYSTLDLRFLPILILAPMMNFFIGLWIGIEEQKKNKRWILIFGIILNLMVLGLFKYYDFLIRNILDYFPISLISDLLGDSPFLEWTLPLGISFFTFQGISYIVDIYRDELSYKNSLLDVLLYISFFPHLVAGPIVKASEFIPQLKTSPESEKIPLLYAIILICFGLIKKTIFANYLGSDVVDPIFENPEKFGSFDVLFGIYSYAIQIYCDFSAYTDMAIGFALLLGYEFPMNFNQPYRSISLSEFWRRWHISLGRWLKNYLYIPLGGNQKGTSKTYRNLIVTMVLGGLWHGAAWTFIFWGLWHGVGLAIERRYFSFDSESKVKNLMRTFLVFNFICIGWIFFRAEDAGKIASIFSRLINGSFGTVQITTFHFLLFVIGLSFHFLPPIEELEFGKRFKFDWALYATGVAVLLTIIIGLMPGGVSPFIYFRF